MPRHVTAENSQGIIRLVAEHAAALRQVQESFVALCRQLGLSDIGAATAHARDPSAGSHAEANVLPVLDRDRFVVIWRERTCPLGNTLPFRFFEVLLRRPGRYCSHEDLLDEVWEGVRSGSTVRHVVKRLRDRLASAGMEGLARAIDGSERGHYVLRLEHIEKNPTGIQRKSVAPPNRGRAR